MKKTILATALFFSFANADDAVDRIKRQCQHIVYGTGTDDHLASTYMNGVVDGQRFLTPTKKRTPFAIKTSDIVMEMACKEALANNEAESFVDKYQWGVAVTMDKNRVKYRNIH